MNNTTRIAAALMACLAVAACTKKVKEAPPGDTGTTVTTPGASTTRWTKMPGMWTCSGSSSPGSTSSSTSAMVIFPAMAQSGLKFIAVAWKTRLPWRSPFQARTRPKSAMIASSRTYSRLPPCWS
mgnify:CR=1 FL=1